MTNLVTLLGRIVDSTNIQEDGESRYTKLQVAVTRTYKNTEGEYETDIIPVILLNGLAQSVMEYLKKGDLIAVKGRLECTDQDIHVICEKISFLAAKKDSE